MLTFFGSLKCDVYSNDNCAKRFGSKAGKVGGVEGFFDATADERAEKRSVRSVGSFVCKRQGEERSRGDCSTAAFHLRELH